MKLFENFYALQHPWQTVTLANWNKYPNPHSAHVLSCDTLSRHISPDGIITTERLLCCRQPVPSLLKRLGLGFSELAYFHEISTLNSKTKEFTAQTVNLSMRSLLTVTETCILTADPSSPASGTLFKQKAQVSAMGVLSSFGRLVEDLAVNRFISNAAKGKDALELVTSRIWADAMDFENKMEQKVSDSLDHLKLELEELTSTVAQNGLDLVRSSLELGSPF
jgi:hypothetical protein